MDSPPSARRSPAAPRLVALLLPVLATGPLNAQEAAPQDAGAPGRVLVLRVGHLHPVSGPVIEDGILVIRQGRIAAVGPAGEVEIPEGAERLDFPDGHAYPGLIDALTTAFADEAIVRDASFDAGAPIWHALFSARPEEARDLVAAGVTTAYVANRSDSTWRGLGAIVRPNSEGFELWKDMEEAAVQLRMTAGPGNTNALQRQAAFAAVEAEFRALEAYRKALEDHEKAVEKYEKEFAEYLEWHRKNKESGAGGNEKGGTEESGAGAGPRRGRGPRGRRGAGGRGGPPSGQRPPAAGGTEPPGGNEKQEPEKPADEEPGKTEAAAKPPERPKYPKPPRKDPAKDTLLEITEGNLPLRVEVHRPDEVRAALSLAREQGIPRLVLEDASAAGRFPRELLEAGAAVVLTNVLPGSLPDGYGDLDTTRLPEKLLAAGVAVAIGSGSAAAARHLPMIAAYAAGAGMGEAAALRSVTLTPAEILGIAADAGSLQEGKLADVVVTSAPLFRSDSRVQTVLSAGRTVFEAR